MVPLLIMATFRKLLYVPCFDTQSPQTDKESGYNGENNKRLKLYGLTQETTPLLFPDVTSPQITPCLSRKGKTNHILRLYANMISTVNLGASKGGKSRRAKRVTYDCVEQPHSKWFKTHVIYIYIYNTLLSKVAAELLGALIFL